MSSTTNPVNELGIDKGEWTAHNDTYHDTWSVSGEDSICDLYYLDEETHRRHPIQEDLAEAHAKLIADAGTTANATGKLPSTLARDLSKSEQRVKDLEGAAQAVIDRWDSLQWEWAPYGPTGNIIANLRALLNPQRS